MNVVFDDSVGEQARQWFKDVLASSKIDFNKAIASRVTVKMVADPSVPGHNDYACTTAIPGGWLIEIRRGLDDPASPLVANIPGPARLFFMETVAHELAHVLIGQSVTKPATLCPLFVRIGANGVVTTGTLADWNISTRPAVVATKWEDRIEEAVAETVKDAALPDRRVYDNRTNWRLSEANFAALMTALLGAGGEFTDDFETDSSSRYLTSGDEVVYSGGRVHSAGGTAQLTPRAAHFGDNLHVQVEVHASDPATAIVGIQLTDPAYPDGSGNSIIFALVNGDVFLQGTVEPVSFGTHAFLDLWVQGDTTTATVTNAAQAVVYSQTFATGMVALEPNLLLFDTAEVERWSVSGDPVTITVTTIPDRIIPEQRTTLSWQSSAISPTVASAPVLGEPTFDPLYEPRDWWYDAYFTSWRQLRVWVYDVTDIWENEELHLEVWRIPYTRWWSPSLDFDGTPQVGTPLYMAYIDFAGQQDLVAYTDGTVPIDDTPFTSENIEGTRIVGERFWRPEDRIDGALFPGYGLSAWLSTTVPTVAENGVVSGDEHATHRLWAASRVIDEWWKIGEWYELEPYYELDPIGLPPPPPDVPVYLVLTALITVDGLADADERAPDAEISYAFAKAQEEAARSLWPKVESVNPAKHISGSTTVEVVRGGSAAEAPDWPYVPPFVAASAGAPAALRLR